jgi:hypothetical protein
MFLKHRMSDNTLTTLMGHVPSRYGSSCNETLLPVFNLFSYPDVFCFLKIWTLRSRAPSVVMHHQLVPPQHLTPIVLVLRLRLTMDQH